MGLWSGFKDALTAAPEVVNKTADAVISTGDKLVFTQEEKSDFNERYREWVIKYLSASNPQNITRRFIAVIVVAVWAALVVSTAVFAVVGVWFPPAHEASLQILNILSQVVDDPFNIVLGLYFMTHLARGIDFGGKK